jgi:hypothetical protein
LALPKYFNLRDENFPFQKVSSSKKRKKGFKTEGRKVVKKILRDFQLTLEHKL